MSRANEFMNKVWEARNSGADTEQKLVSEILKLAAETVTFFTAQSNGNNFVVLSKEDLLSLSEEIKDV